ncbi:MAG TPA: energy transducer TonB [Candidatus Eremiobacteraceae bacterium]|nr:energy transducer TonB [Candidatus Eremiobacteraceae bacterium]
MKHFAFILFVLTASTFVSVREARADSCPLRLAYAGLVALGTPHGTAEYELDFAPGQGYDTGPFTVKVTATISDSSRVDFEVEAVSTKVSGTVTGEGEERVYPFAAEVRSFRIDSARDWKGLSTCSADPGYAVADDSKSSVVSFDDGPGAAWPLKSAGQIEIVDADFTGRQAPEYPKAAAANGLEGVGLFEGYAYYRNKDFDDLANSEGVGGSAIVLVVINADGSVATASIYQSSGNAVLDQASLKAARASTFKPARLSKALGGAAITSAYLIVYAFNATM